MLGKIESNQKANAQNDATSNEVQQLGLDVANLRLQLTQTNLDKESATKQLQQLTAARDLEASSLQNEIKRVILNPSETFTVFLSFLDY